MSNIVKVQQHIHHTTCGEPQCYDFYDLTTTITYRGEECVLTGDNGDESKLLLTWVANKFNLKFEFDDTYSSEED